MEKLQVYKCNVCGNIVEVLHVGGGTLVCCKEEMQHLAEKSSAEEGNEKHVPVVEETENGIKVKVGSVPHPMEEDHYIQWAEVITDEKVYREFFKPGTVPEAGNINLRQGDADQPLTLPANHLPLRHIFTQVLFDLPPHNLAETVKIALDSLHRFQ